MASCDRGVGEQDAAGAAAAVDVAAGTERCDGHGGGSAGVLGEEQAHPVESPTDENVSGDHPVPQWAETGPSKEQSRPEETPGSEHAEEALEIGGSFSLLISHFSSERVGMGACQPVWQTVGPLALSYRRGRGRVVINTNTVCLGDLDRCHASSPS